MTKSYNSRIKYIDSLKGIACMFIFIGHYLLWIICFSK